jgi:hypothetical protein
MSELIPRTEEQAKEMIEEEYRMHNLCNAIRLLHGELPPMICTRCGAKGPPCPLGLDGHTSLAKKPEPNENET